MLACGHASNPSPWGLRNTLGAWVSVAQIPTGWPVGDEVAVWLHPSEVLVSSLCLSVSGECTHPGMWGAPREG